ncbi:hypothetical protein G5714_017042 [Onychostoma macrolepis]|uniref:Uncharacterized protein n=1 Tax=Onychostoma macrolepis TaxID=369639 RepID=A0A7J6C8Y6_9TELE|nr:hypothetical protein G5714_017042 [Onychostoma macrolepis]
MNKIWILCFAVLIITIPFSAQNSDAQKSSAGGSGSTSSTNSSAVGLGPVPTTLYLLIPAATLGFIHSRS